jgi:hypothetical protein
VSERSIGQINVPPGRAQVRDVPENARPYKWKPGQSGNPAGRSGLYGECRRLAAEASPSAMCRLIELMDAQDNALPTWLLWQSSTALASSRKNTTPARKKRRFRGCRWKSERRDLRNWLPAPRNCLPAPRIHAARAGKIQLKQLIDHRG